jgi:hypothetical protein
MFVGVALTCVCANPGLGVSSKLADLHLRATFGNACADSAFGWYVCGGSYGVCMPVQVEVYSAIRLFCGLVWWCGFREFRAQHRQRITLFSTALLYCPRLAILYELVAGPGDLVSNTFSTWCVQPGGVVCSLCQGHGWGCCRVHATCCRGVALPSIPLPAVSRRVRPLLKGLFPQFLHRAIAVPSPCPHRDVHVP